MSLHLMDFDLPVMIAFAVALVPMMLMGLKITRWNGSILLGTWAACVVCLLRFAS